MNVKTIRDQVVHAGVESSYIPGSFTAACGAHVKTLRSGRTIGQPTTASTAPITCPTCQSR